MMFEQVNKDEILNKLIFEYTALEKLKKCELFDLELEKSSLDLKNIQDTFFNNATIKYPFNFIDIFVWKIYIPIN